MDFSNFYVMSGNKHKSHFIPSPFKAVTQYENVFIKDWRKNTASAVAEVLKYLAQATASALKNKGEFEIKTEKTF